MSKLGHASAEVPARAILEHLAGQEFESWVAFGRTWKQTAPLVGKDVFFYARSREAIQFAHQAGWIALHATEDPERHRVTVAEEFVTPSLSEPDYTR